MNINDIENKFSSVSNGLKPIAGEQERAALKEVEFILAEVAHYVRSIAHLAKGHHADVEHRLLASLCKYHEVSDMSRCNFGTAEAYEAAHEQATA